MNQIPIMDIGVLLFASRNKAYRLSIVESFRVLVSFLQENELTQRKLLQDGLPPEDDFKLYESDLTDDGVALVDRVVPRWFSWIEKGNPVENTAILERGLKRIRKG